MSNKADQYWLSCQKAYFFRLIEMMQSITITSYQRKVDNFDGTDNYCLLSCTAALHDNNYCDRMQWTSNLAAFEMVASKTETRSATTRSQLPSSKQLCIKMVIKRQKDWVLLWSVCNWMGRFGNYNKSVCDKMVINCGKSIGIYIQQNSPHGFVTEMKIFLHK